jgi:hypothetical protein
MTQPAEHAPEQYSDADFVRVADLYIDGVRTLTGKVAERMSDNLLRLRESSPEQWQTYLNSKQTVNAED